MLRVAEYPRRYYRYYMTIAHLKVARIGNSRGVRIPAATLRRLGIGDAVVMEERSDGILLRPVHSAQGKLSWHDTAQAMGDAAEHWSEWESLSGDGLQDIERRDAPPALVAEAVASYEVEAHKTSRKTGVPKKAASSAKAPRGGGDRSAK